MARKRTGGAPHLIEDPEGLSKLIERLAKQPRVALDTEAASFHRYVDRVYLIQVSSDAETALIDPLAIQDLAPLGMLLADPEIEVIIHDADYDLRILNRDYGFSARTVFDTRIAAQFAGEPAVGLGALLDKYFGITPNKKLQRADWSRRPLTSEMIEYAADDTRYLLALRDKLEGELVRKQRLDWAREEFSLLEGIRWKRAPRDDQAFLRIKGAKNLSPRGLAILSELHKWREATAKRLDRAPFRVLGNAPLLALARAAPRKRARLEAVPGVPASAARLYTQDILTAIERGMQVAQKDLPKLERRRRPEHDQAYDRRLERLKGLRNRCAKERNMEPGMLCPNGTLQAVARSAPRTARQLHKVAELRQWQANVLGEAEILEAILAEET